MSFKFVLSATLVLLVCSFTVSAQTPQRAAELYIDFESTQTCPNCNCQIPKCRCYGWRGQPWSDCNSGGCRCGKKCGLTQYNFSSHWPSPFSVFSDHGRHGTKWRKSADTTHPRLRDKLDILAHVRLLPPVRKDNGYCGRFCDPYGLLGQSRRGVVVDGGIESAPVEEVAPTRIPEQASQKRPSANREIRLGELPGAASPAKHRLNRMEYAAQLWPSRSSSSLKR